GSDFHFFMSEDKSFLLPAEYSAESTYSIIEEHINKDTNPKRTFFSQYIGYAAAILILALISTIVYNYLTQPVTFYASTSHGEKKEVNLPDGSVVILNSMSSVSYSERMIGRTRELVLQGEAYFDVAKDPDKAFVVKAKDIEVKVLGTKFNVKAYENQEYIETTLFAGVVSVGLPSGEVRKLKPGEQAIFEEKTKNVEIRQLKDPGIEMAWQNNILVFDNEPFTDILETLSREYNVIFEVENDILKQLHMTARFSTEESVDTALTILGESAEFTYTRQNNIYTITRGK
ncbi:DUF4974 domain-containing protein, partial [Dysgonomonas sp. OttesenSCG-928-M03]|nr:DUF4974 domain-containing protein [Dysgonomonas sp. OttesenSCG-928-M03]